MNWLGFFLVCAAFLLIVLALSMPSAPKTPEQRAGITRYVDEATGNVCYLIRSGVMFRDTRIDCVEVTTE